MVRSQGNEGLPKRLTSGKRKLPGSRNRLPFRHRTKRAVLPKTPLEKASLAAKRLNHRRAYNDALARAREVLTDQATILRNEFGGHSIQYYLQEICQMSRIVKSGRRNESSWNAFLRSEVKKVNDGTYLW